MKESVEESRPAVTFGEAAGFWLKLGFISFGGPGAQIAIMHSELVERRRWISEERFLHALNYCMLLPGPEAQQLATYIGWLLHRTAGGIVAGALFVLPSMILLWGLSWIYVTWGTVPQIAAVFHGLKSAVLAVVTIAVWRLGRKALRTPSGWMLAGAAFLALFVFHLPFPAVLLSAAVIGWVIGKMEKNTTHRRLRITFRRPLVLRFVLLAMTGLIVWWMPTVVLALWLGAENVLVKEGVFFGKAALVTFGGAYAVLPYVSQQAVAHFGWLSAGQMLDGLGLAETTPGPLIMVLQFVGFLGAWNHPGNLPPLLAASLGAFITTWATFIPSFLFIFLGAPFMEQLREARGLSSILSAVTAAVVGVIANLAVWFGMHLLILSSGQVDWFSLVSAAASFVLLLKMRWGIIPVILLAGLAGLLHGSMTL